MSITPEQHQLIHRGNFAPADALRVYSSHISTTIHGSQNQLKLPGMFSYFPSKKHEQNEKGRNFAGESGFSFFVNRFFFFFF